MGLVGIGGLADAQAGLLSTGQQRLVELARVLAGGFDVLLLDEPSAGLDATRPAASATCCRRAVAERECGILLVEHDMEPGHAHLPLHLRDGLRPLIFEGSTDQMITDSIVRTAYLGERSSELDAENVKAAGG